MFIRHAAVETVLKGNLGTDRLRGGNEKQLQSFQNGKCLPEVATEGKGQRRKLQIVKPGWTWDKTGLLVRLS